MAELTGKKRAKISKQKFALPEQRAYPVHDAKHAKNAKARASQMYKAGKLSRGELTRVVAAANKTLGKAKGKGSGKTAGKSAADIAKQGKPRAKVKSAAARIGKRVARKGKTVTVRKGKAAAKKK